VANLVVTMTGLQLMLDDLRTHYFNAACLLHLFKNAKTPAIGDNLGMYQECDFPGYAPVAIHSWGTAHDSGSQSSETDHPPVTFTCNGTTVPNTIYGYYVTDGSSNLLWAQADPNPFYINTAGQTYTVTGQFLLADLP